MIEKIVSLNLPLHKIHPDLICGRCLLRSEKKKIRAGIFKRYSLVVCRSCGSSLYLIKGIKQIVGLIGGDVDGYRADGDRAYVKLWDNAARESRNADIDLLEIREARGWDENDYDYAVNAVWLTLKNDVSRPGDYVRKIPVVIRGNPPISEGAKRILRYEFGGIEDE